MRAFGLMLADGKGHSDRLRLREGEWDELEMLDV
jgi:hypothetical protein